MLRAEALATLVAFERPTAVEGLRSYLAEPYGSVPLAAVVADAQFCALDIHDVIADRLRSAENVNSERELSGLLAGLTAWGRAAEIFVPELAALLQAGVAEPAVLDVLARIGPGVAAVEDQLLVHVRSDDATPAGRGAAASALIRSGRDSASEAASALASMLDRTDTVSAAVMRLAELDQLPPSLPMGLTEWLAKDSPSPVVRAGAARVLWNSGRRRRALAQTLVQGIGPCAAGVRCVEWLADMGDLASPHRSVLSHILKSRRRPQCDHVGDRVVAADERYQIALAQALSVIPRPGGI